MVSVPVLAVLLTIGSFAPQLSEGDTVPSIPLVDQDGRSFSLQNLRGRIVVLSFIYTRCTGSCALVSAKLAAIARDADLASTAVLALTVDPAFDRPARLHRYRAMFQTPSRWTIATGSPVALLLLERRLGVEPQTENRRTGHADIVVILDGAGRIVRLVSGNDWQPDRIVAIARGAAAKEPSPLTAVDVFLRDAASRCGRGGVAVSAGSAIVLTAALTLAFGFPLIRALSR